MKNQNTNSHQCDSSYKATHHLIEEEMSKTAQMKQHLFKPNFVTFLTLNVWMRSKSKINWGNCVHEISETRKNMNALISKLVRKSITFQVKRSGEKSLLSAGTLMPCALGGLGEEKESQDSLLYIVIVAHYCRSKHM